jgi:deoxyribodipyrimidine photolyase
MQASALWFRRDLRTADHRPGRRPFVTELAWREYYADVLWRRPDSGWRDLRPLTIPYDDPVRRPR